MKKLPKFIFLLFPILLFSSFLQASSLPPNQNIFDSLPPMGEMPQISMEDLEAIDDFLKQLEKENPEALEALAKIGEDFIKEAEAQGIDPYQALGFPFSKQDVEEAITTEGGVMPSPQPPAPDTKKEEITIPKMDLKKVEEAREMIEHIVQHLNNLKIKLLADPFLQEIFSSFNFLVDDLVYYLSLVKEEKILKYLLEKEFEHILQALFELNHTLSYLVPAFDMPEESLETTNPYTILGVPKYSPWNVVSERYQTLLIEKDAEKIKENLMKKKASQQEINKKLAEVKQELSEVNEAYEVIVKRENALLILNKIIDALAQIAYQKNILAQLKKVLEKYEPEAMKKREEQEKLEAKARESQELALKQRAFAPPPHIERDDRFGRRDFAGSLDLPSPSYSPSYSPSFPTGDSRDRTRPGMPDRTSRPGEKPTPTPGKPDAAKGKKEGLIDEKAKAAKDSAAKKAAAAPGAPSLDKKVENIEKELKDLYFYLDEPDPKNPTASIKNITLLKDFDNFLVTSNEDNIKVLQDIFTEMASKIGKASRELVDPTFSEQDKKQLREKAKTKVENLFRKIDNHKNIKNIHSLKFKTTDAGIFFADDANVTKEKRFAFTGEVAKGLNIDDPKNKAIKDLNIKATNFLGNYLKARLKFIDALEGKKRK